MTVWERLSEAPEAELLPLLQDAYELDRTGVLPADAPLRNFTEAVLGDSAVLKMLSVSYNLYKLFALRHTKGAT